MAKTVPTEYEQVRPERFFATKPIREDEWSLTNQNANYIYSRSGGRFCLFGGLAATDSATNVTTGITDYQAVFRPSKKIDDSGTTVYRVTVKALVRDIAVTVKFQDATGTYADKTVDLGSSAGSLEWVEKGTEFTSAQAGVIWHVYIDGYRSTDSPTTGDLRSVLCYEDILTASDMP